MPYLTPTVDQIRARILHDIQNRLHDADIKPDSDHYARASAFASAVEGLYQHQAWIVRQIFPDLSDSAEMRHHAALRGIIPRPARIATGTMTLTGTPGTVVDAGIAGVFDDDTAIVTTAGGTVAADGTLTVEASATVAGTAGNREGEITLTVPPVGIAGTAQGGLINGTDAESDASLLARLLDKLRNPPAGGNDNDYRAWAKAVPGVAHAWVYPRLRGLGTVDVFITAPDGLPSTQLMIDVLAYIDERRPVGLKGVAVRAPTLVEVPMYLAIQPSGAPFDTVAEQLRAQLLEWWALIEPGQTFVKSQVETLVSNHANVSDRKLINPPDNIEASISADGVDWFQPGLIEIDPLL